VAAEHLANEAASLPIVRATHSRGWTEAIFAALLDPRPWLFWLLMRLPVVYLGGAWWLPDPSSTLGLAAAVGVIACRHAGGLTAARQIRDELARLPQRQLSMVRDALVAIEDLHAQDGSPRLDALLAAATPTYVRCTLECARDLADCVELQRLHAFSGADGVGPAARAAALELQLQGWTQHLQQSRSLLAGEQDPARLQQLEHVLDALGRDAVQLLVAAESGEPVAA
jgi:hypothetical protein